MRRKQMIIVVGIIVFTLFACSPKTPEVSTQEQEIKRSEKITVGVLYFDAHSNDEGVKAAAGGLTDMFIAELSNFSQFRVIERTKLENAINELGLREELAGGIDEKTAQRIGKLLSAQTLFYGSITELLGKIKLSARLVRVETAEVLAAESSKPHSVDETLELVTEVSEKIAVDIDKKYNLLLADNYYSKGWHAEEDGYFDKAIEWYKKAIDCYPNHQQAKRALTKFP